MQGIRSAEDMAAGTTHTSNGAMNDRPILQLYRNSLIVEFHQKPGGQIRIAV